jgi:catalase
MSEQNFTTNGAGIPVASDEHSLTVGPDGPILLQDHYLIEKMAQFNRERVPERQPHAKGGGAFGRLEVTNDVSAYTKADLFQPGRKTDLLIRFSTVAGERGSPDTWRDPRAFEYWHNVDSDLGDKVESGVRGITRKICDSVNFSVQVFRSA